MVLGFSPKTFINPQVWSQREPQPITHIIQTTLLKKHTNPHQKISFSLSLSLSSNLKAGVMLVWLGWS